MALPVTFHTRRAVFAGAEKQDFIFGCRKGNRLECGSRMTVVAEWLALAQSAAAPEISEALQHPHRAWPGVGNPG